MGKEVKIGLAVLTVLVGVFGFLLYKKFTAKPSLQDSHADTAASGHEHAKPTLLTDEGQKASSLMSRTWVKASADDRYDSATSAPQERNEPRASFMPAAEPSNVGDRYAYRGRRSEPDSAPPTEEAAPTSSDPFRRPRVISADETASPPPRELTPTTEPDLQANPGAPTPDLSRPVESNPLRSRGTPRLNDSSSLDSAQDNVAQDNFRAPADRPDRYAAPPPADTAEVATIIEPAIVESAQVEPAALPEAPAQSLAAEPAPGVPRSIVSSSRTLEAEGVQVDYTTAAPATYNAPDGRYVVQPNDNYWLISQKVYGKGGYFKAIHYHNRAKFPQADKLQVGDILTVPPVAQLEENYPELCPKARRNSAPSATMQQASVRQRPAGGRTYLVEEGDTLFDIARYELGKASRWGEIYDLNRDILGDDFDHLNPGTELLLPEAPTGDSMTRRAAPGIQR